MTIEQHVSLLRDAGLRVTKPRLAALHQVAASPHTTADQIADGVRAQLGTVSKQAIYDILHTLTAASILRRISVDGRGAQYELNHRDNHHHVVCRRCGRLEDVPCPKGEAPCLAPPSSHGFAIDEAEVVYRGLCSACH